MEHTFSVRFEDVNGIITPISAILFSMLRNTKILDWSKLKQIADDILKCI